MTDPRKVLDDAVEAAARAMARSKAWPVVFEAGSADLLARAAILAALPVIGEAIVDATDLLAAGVRQRTDEDDDQMSRHFGALQAKTISTIAAAQREFIERMMG